MQTVLFANGRLGVRIARYLREREELAALVLHPGHRRNWPDDQGDLLGVPTLSWPVGVGDLERLDPQCLLSVMFGYLIPDELLELPAWRSLNLHPGLLPWNRGADPNVWPLVDGSPAGTTLHVMCSEIDAGPIIVQRRVDYGPADTAETLYDRLLDASHELLVEHWPDVRTIEPFEQPSGGSHHRRADLASLDLDASDERTLSKLRGRTFGAYGATLYHDGRRYRVRVNIEPD